MLHQAQFNAYRPVIRLLRFLAKGSECFQSLVSRSIGDVAKKPLKMPLTMPMAMPMSMSMYPTSQQSGSLACCLSQANASPLASSILVMCKHADTVLPEYTRQQMQKPLSIYHVDSLRMDSTSQHYPHYNHHAHSYGYQVKNQQPKPKSNELSCLVSKLEKRIESKRLDEKNRQSDGQPAGPGNSKPAPKPTRPMYNPLSRRHTVDRARLQYINDMFKELAEEVEMRKPKSKKFVSRSSLHSGRNDKID